MVGYFHFKTDAGQPSIIMMVSGPKMITQIAGKIQPIIGKIILIEAWAACSSTR